MDFKKINYINNNNSINNSFSISQRKKTDEELSKDIFIHILRINFFNFLKNIKESNRHKLLLINCYFFLVKHAYNPFIKNLRLQVKNKKLKQKIKAFQCRIFFHKTKSQINLIKNPNGNKITTVHAYLYYYNILRKKVITGLKRVSKPGLRVYVGADEIPQVLNGLGIAILSTSKGIMTGKQAKEAHQGGEVLAYVW